MPFVDVKARRQRELNALVKKVIALTKGKKYCEIDHGPVEPAELDFQHECYWIEIRSPYELSSELRDLVNKCPNFEYISHNDYPGSYDWASDTYIKDTSAVMFKIK